MQTNTTEIKKLIGEKIGSYYITHYINSGSFGHVFQGRDNNNNLVAIKIPIKTSDKDGSESIKKEINIYKKISNPDKGVVNMKYENYNDTRVIVMDLLGCSLEKVLSIKKKLALKSIIYLSMQMIKLLKHIHSFGYVHRDLKPDNFITDISDKSKIYCIDFGLSKSFMKNNFHIPLDKNRSFCGTARWAPIAAHLGHSQSRKDDLESIAYILVYLYKGTLPWMSIKHKDKETRYKLIGEAKHNITEELLCKGMPKEFSIFLKYVRTMDFDEKPPYSSFYKMFYKLYQSKNYKNNEFDYAI